MTNLFQMLGLGGNQAQMPGMAGQEQTNPLQRLLAPEFALPMAAGLLGNQGNAANFGQGFANAAPFMALQRQQRETSAQTSKTLAFLQDKAPDIAAAVESGALPPADGWKAYLDRQRHEKGQGYINAGGGNLFNSETGEWMSAPGSDVPETGLTPQMMRDPNTGETIYVQATKDGRVIRSQVPEGFQPYDPYSKAYETGRGTAAGKGTAERGLEQPQAEASLNTAVNSLDRLDAAADQLIKDPSLDRITGLWGMVPNYPGGQAAGSQARLNTLKSQVGFSVLQAMREASKTGGALGAISDKENELLQNNLASLEQAQSPEDLRRELQKIRDYVAGAKMRLQNAYVQTYSGSAPAPGPANVGSIKQKYGLD